MRLSIRWMLLTGLALAAIAAAVGTTPVAAQVNTADARAFIGDWNVAVAGEAPVTIRINITDSAGRLAVQVTGSEGQVVSVEKVTRNGSNLVLDYVTTLQGTQLPIIVTLTPEGDGLTGNLDLAGGMYTAPLKGTKRTG